MTMTLVGAIDVAALKEPLTIAGLVFAGAGAILWFGSTTLDSHEQNRVRSIGTGLGLIAPVFLAWSFLTETGTIALWALLSFFGLFLGGAILVSLLLPRLLSRCSCIAQQTQEKCEKSHGNRGDTEQNSVPDRMSERGEYHVLSVELNVPRSQVFALVMGAAVGALAMRYARDRPGLQPRA